MAGCTYWGYAYHSSTYCGRLTNAMPNPNPNPNPSPNPNQADQRDAVQSVEVQLRRATLRRSRGPAPPRPGTEVHRGHAAPARYLPPAHTPPPTTPIHARPPPLVSPSGTDATPCHAASSRDLLRYLPSPPPQVHRGHAAPAGRLQQRDAGRHAGALPSYHP